MHLLNVSAGRVQTVRIGSEDISTAHVKAPVDPPWVITENGVQGDERAVHPDKLYAFPRTAYEYWGAALGVDPATWPDGFFGENLTLDDLNEADLRVGDVLALGPTVRLVVSGARTPCLKLAWRLGQPRSFQKQFARSGRSGVYLGVLTPGTVSPGDRLERLAHDPAMPSITDVCLMIDDHTPPPLDVLNRLMACPHLSPANRMLLGAKQEAAERAAEQSEHRWRGWRTFTIDAVAEEARNTRSFRLVPEDGGPLCQMRPGQFVSVRLTAPDGTKVMRTWSLSDFAYDPQSYRITVLKQHGIGSTLLHTLSPGDTVDLRAPAGNFVLDMGSFRPVVLIAAGVGITPLMAMLRAYLGKRDPGYVHLIYGAKTPEDMAFREDLERLCDAHPGLRVSCLFSRSAGGGQVRGRITAEFVKQALGGMYVELGDKRIDLPWIEADFYLCGPERFCEDLTQAFIAGGANPSHIFSELFSAPPAEETELETATVHFHRSGREATWTLADNFSLLELAEEAGIAAPNECRAGSCLSCRTPLLEGQSTVDAGDGATLLCIARPKSPRIVLDL